VKSFVKSFVKSMTRPLVSWYIYDLETGEPIGPVPVQEASCFRKKHYRVALTELHACYVSTVFLSLDHQFGKGPPLIFETMVFTYDSRDELDVARYTTRDEALEGHKRMVERYTHDLERLAAEAPTHPTEGASHG